VIDPILQSTYLGGDGLDSVSAIAIHPKTGDIYVAGDTMSHNIPKTSGGAQSYYGGGGRDGFVARLNPDLTEIIQSTYLGGSGTDAVYTLAIHPKTGDVYVAGQTYSTDIPNTAGGAQRRHGGGDSDGFISRLNSHLTEILQSTYIGGSGIDLADALAIHPTTGDVYLAGTTISANIPRTAGGAQERNKGYDAFISRLNPDLTQIIQSTYLGGYDGDSTSALTIHPKTGDVYVAGQTSSYNFPKATGGAQVNYGGGDSDVFISRLNSDLTQIIQSTYLGGNGTDWCSNLAIHPKTGNIYVAGHTNSTNLPNITGGAQESNRGHDDVYVARLNSDLTQIIQSTYLGGSSNDWCRDLSIHPKTGDVYVVGATLSTNFPATTGVVQGSCGNKIEEFCHDAFISRLNPDLTQIIQSTYLGEDGQDSAKAIAIHPKTGDIYVAGETSSYNFPKTAGGAQVSHGGGLIDVFVARLTADLAASSSSDKKTKRNPSNSKDHKFKKKQ
jgi:hypothetical protein